MTKLSRKNGFTLIELLIGMVLMVIVIAGITFGITSGVRLYERANAQALVINGVRFTMDSFNRQITPKLSNTNYVEILNTIPAKNNLSDDEKCLFRSGDAVVIRTKNGNDTILTGSECISAVHFTAISRDDATNTSGDNYTLKMVLSADNPQYNTAKYSAVTLQSLYNKPVRSTDNFIADAGSSKNGTYEGNVLIYVEKEDLSLSFKSLHLLDAKDTGKSLDKQTINRADISKLYSSYDLKFDSDPGFAYTDESTTEWYISGSTASEDSVTSTVAFSSKSDSDTRNSHRWLLVGTDGSTLASSHNDSVISDTNSNFRVKISGYSTGKDWETSWGVVWCKVTPILKRTSDGKIYTASPKWTPYVVLVRSGARGDSLLARWMYDVNPNTATDDEYRSGFFKTSTGMSTKSSFQLDTEGNAYMTITGKVNGSTVTAGLNQTDLLDRVSTQLNAVSKDKEEGRYTTLTNYSVIVDADTENGNGWGFLFNGASAADNYTDNGYVVQCDKAIDSFPIRLFAKNYAQNPDTSKGIYKYIGITGVLGNGVTSLTNDGYNYRRYKGSVSGLANVYDNNVPMSGIRADWGPMTYYGPGYLKTTSGLFMFGTNSTSSSRGSEVPWLGRRRVMITVLEYYTTNKAEPKFIVRVKYLKAVPDNYTEDAKDPWECGKNFFCSEPMWYGDFVGAKAQTFTKSGTSYYKYYVNNFHYPSDDYGKSIVYKKSYNTGDEGEACHYITYSPYASGDFSDSNMRATIFSGKEMDIRDAIENSTYESGTSEAVQQSSLFTDPARKRYIALRVWNYSTAASTTVKFYGMDYAPGFTKEELLAIMPSGAKMYETSDTGQDKSDTEKLHEKLNYHLFGADSGSSSGNGVGVMGIQHLNKSTCDCPMCQLVK